MTTPPTHSETSARPQTAPAQTRVLVVDDHPIFRHGMIALLSAEQDFVVCGEAESASSAMEAMRTLQPEIALVDIALQGANGLDLVKQMKAEQPDLRILVVSMHEESMYALRALRAGAGGYVTKQEALMHIATAMRTVLKGGTYLGARFREQLVFKVMLSVESGVASLVDKLSERESEVLHLLGQGMSTREIAEALTLSIKTVETHRAHIKDKLKLRDSNEMVRFAIDWVTHQEA